jgi:hypothetical protein
MTMAERSVGQLGHVDGALMVGAQRVVEALINFFQNSKTHREISPAEENV